MDFDDLDAVAEERLAQGEEVVGHVVVNNQAAKGTLLQPITRSRRLPRDGMLPDKAQKLLGAAPELKPKLRLICFYGAGDSVAATWAQMAHDVLDEGKTNEIEVATYEWPGHGIRERDKLRHRLEDLCDDAFEAVRETLDSGSFAVLGHSIGCLLATAVCERAHRELKVEPVYAVMLERGAPNFPVLSKSGQEMLRNNIDEFLVCYGVPFVARLGGEHGKAMWQNDMELENDTREVGWYKFSCPILAVCALRNYDMDMVEESQLDDKSKLFKKRREEEISYFATSYNFSMDMYKAWGEWTDHPDGARVLAVASDHYGVKTHKDVRTEIWKALRETISAF